LSFEVFVQCFERGQFSGSPVAAVWGAFNHVLDTSSDAEWKIRYDDTNRCNIYVHRHEERPELVHSITVNRPCADVRLWNSLHQLLRLGNWVLYFPAEKPPLLIANESTALHLPESMREALGPVKVVNSGDDIIRIIRGP
jgi:hypothetical protein